MGGENAGDDNKENPDNGSEEKEPEDKVKDLTVQDVYHPDFATMLWEW